MCSYSDLKVNLECVKINGETSKTSDTSETSESREIDSTLPANRDMIPEPLSDDYIHSMLQQ